MEKVGKHYTKAFFFEAFWLTHLDFNNLINAVWKNFKPPDGTKMYQFQQKLKNLKNNIKHWNKLTFGNIFQAQSTLDQEMKKIQQRIITEERSQSRENNYKHKYQKEQSKKKYLGNKSQELDGLKRVKETQSSFIALLSCEECITTSPTSRISKGSGWKNMRM